MASSLFLCGSNGALGRAIARNFMQKKWKVVGCDIVKTSLCDTPIQLDYHDSLEKQTNDTCKFLRSTEYANSKFDAVFCVSGGFAMANLKDECYTKYANDMMRVCCYSSILSAKIATHFLKENGLLILAGAEAVIEPSAALIAYSPAKAYVHHLTKVLAHSECGLPLGVKTICILPRLLNTELNRKQMGENILPHSTSLEELADTLHSWVSDSSDLINGSGYKIITKDNRTEYIPVTL